MKKRFLLGMLCALLIPLGISSCDTNTSVSSQTTPSSEVSTGEVTKEYCTLTTNFDEQVGGKVDYEVKHADGTVINKSNYNKLVAGDVISIKSVKANEGYTAVSLFVNSTLKNDGGYSEDELDLDLLTPTGAQLNSIDLEVEKDTVSIELVVTFTKNA